MQTKYLLYFFITILLVSGGFLGGFSAAKQYYGDVESRLQLLEGHFVNQLKPGQEIKMDELKIYMDKQTDEIKDQYGLFLKLGLPLSIAALLASIFAAYRWAAEIAKEEAGKAFVDPDKLLKAGKKILVITPDGDDEIWLRKFFQLMDFESPTFKKKSEIESVNDKSFDIVILNVPSDQPRQPSAYNDFLDQLTMAKSVFYFGAGQATNKHLDEFGKLSFANAKSQLYGNLINALKFQKMLQ